MHSLFTVLSFHLLSVTYAAIGPEANVFIENKVISPDGFNRSYVYGDSQCWRVDMD